MYTIDDLRRIADASTCDGTCDEKPPYKPCKGCEAKYTLNDIADQINEVMRYLEAQK